MKKLLLIFMVFTLSFLQSEPCDLNEDGDLNIVDIVIMVNIILDHGEEFCDMNGDGQLNIVDIVQVINAIFYGFNIELITIQPGNYLIPNSDEPQAVDYAYQIGKYEVTFQQYLSYLNDAHSNGEVWIGDCIGYLGNSCVNGNFYSGMETIERSFFVLGNARSYELVEYHYGIIEWSGTEFILNDALYLDHPAVNVSWYGADHFANYNGFRLPSYNEWVRAARAETSWDWPWSNSGSNRHLRINVLNSDFSPDENFEYPWPDGTTPVGFYNGENNTLTNVSSFGLYDLVGNAWEWIADPSSYNPEFKRSLGGAWDWDLGNSRLKWVYQTSLGHPTWSTGFRVVKDQD